MDNTFFDALLKVAVAASAAIVVVLGTRRP
jgi:hypothetical protein